MSQCSTCTSNAGTMESDRRSPISTAKHAAKIDVNQLSSEYLCLISSTDLVMEGLIALTYD